MSVRASDLQRFTTACHDAFSSHPSSCSFPRPDGPRRRAQSSRAWLLRDPAALPSKPTRRLSQRPVARNGVISQDSRIARSVAFESDASNIVAGDRNGRTDVFVVDRAPGYSSTGSPWRNGRTRIASRGLNGPANGRSYGPSISGDSSSDRGRGETAPRCVAFVSQASNLVRGDTDGRADAFLYWMGSGIVQRVSVASDGSQSNGSTYDVAVDGACTRVAFTSDSEQPRADEQGRHRASPTTRARGRGQTRGGSSRSTCA